MRLAFALDDHSGGATTNRPALFEHIKGMASDRPKISVPNEEVQFNGYGVVEQDSHGNKLEQFEVVEV
jgi:hypothetical protein